MLKTIQILIVALLISGCATQTFTINGTAGEVPTEQRTQHFFVSGIGQQKIADAAAICGGVDNIVKVETHLSFLNGFLGFITYGIYTPRQARVYCKA